MSKKKIKARHALRKMERTDLEGRAQGGDSPRRSRSAGGRGGSPKLGDQPPLVAMSLGVIAAGLVGGHDRLRADGLADADRAFAIDHRQAGGEGPGGSHAAGGARREELSAAERHEPRRPPALDAVGAQRGNCRGGRRHRRRLSARQLPGAAAGSGGGGTVAEPESYCPDIIVGAAIGLAGNGLARLLIPPLADRAPRSHARLMASGFAVIYGVLVHDVIECDGWGSRNRGRRPRIRATRAGAVLSESRHRRLARKS